YWDDRYAAHHASVMPQLPSFPDYPSVLVDTVIAKDVERLVVDFLNEL
ncbi:unnamed protein product, partial [marine sediment metagenome]